MALLSNCPAPILAGLLLAAGCSRSVSVPAPVGAGSIEGRWQLAFEVPGATYRTPVAFRVDSARRVHTTVLGPSYVRFDRGSVDGSTLVLRGQSALGAVRLRATMRGDSLDGHWRLKLLFGGGFRGARDPGGTAPGDTSARLAVFDSLARTLRAGFYDPSYGGVPLDSLLTTTRARVQRSVSDADLVETVRPMLRAFHASHLDFAALRTEDAIVTAHAERGASPITWRRLRGDVGYIRVERFEEGADVVQAIDSAFAGVQDLPRLVIDVRGNPGGTLSAAMRIGDWLYPAPQTLGGFATQAALRAAGARSIAALPLDRMAVYDGYDVNAFMQRLREAGAVRLVTGGRVPSPYRGRVALLVDGRCASTTEAFAAVLQETRRATIVGERTAGAMLSAREVPLPHGWWIRFPEADFRTPAGQRVEGAGVEPQVVSRQRHLVPLLDRRDVQLRRAVAVLRSEQVPDDPGPRG